MAGRQLAAYVHLNDEAGRVHTFGPGDEVPSWAAKKITNPKAWAEPEPKAQRSRGSGRDEAEKSGE